MLEQRVYADTSAGTAIDSRVLSVMYTLYQEGLCNADSIHAEGVRTRAVLEDARRGVARALQVRAEEIVFTSGGTEANNLALFGLVRALKEKGRAPEQIHIVTSVLEHSSVRSATAELLKEGVCVSQVPVDKEGFVDLSALAQAITKDTVLVSFVYAHNELGTIQKTHALKEVLDRARALLTPDLLLHLDANQAPAWLQVHPHTLGADLVSFDAQKMYGPKGVGCLYVRQGVTLLPFAFGGGQERGLRAGTVPVELVAGFAEAFRIAEAERAEYVPRVRALRDDFVEKVLAGISSAQIHGAIGGHRLPNNAYFSFEGKDSETLVLALDAMGVACSSKSACFRESRERSPLADALGLSDARAQSTLRFSFGKDLTKEQVVFVLSCLQKVVR